LIVFQVEIIVNDWRQIYKKYLYLSGSVIPGGLKIQNAQKGILNLIEKPHPNDKVIKHHL